MRCASLLFQAAPNEYSHMIERISHAGKELAVIIRNKYQKDGIDFFTPSDYSQQLGYMKRPTGYVIAAHIHHRVPSESMLTSEVLFVKSGRVRVDFYSQEQTYLESSILERGDVILLALCGHGFEMLEDSEIIEVKQGPYTGDQDKIRFKAICKEQVKIRNAQ
jgi:mannose-6-phosphate isomerase-like protein (cupin superfamily)